MCLILVKPIENLIGILILWTKCAGCCIKLWWVQKYMYCFVLPCVPLFVQPLLPTMTAPMLRHMINGILCLENESWFISWQGKRFLSSPQCPDCIQPLIHWIWRLMWLRCEADHSSSLSAKVSSSSSSSSSSSMELHFQSFLCSLGMVLNYVQGQQ
jgi:hypothetical protein